MDEKPHLKLHIVPVRLTYEQKWPAYTQAQTNEGRLFDELLKDLVADIEEPEQHMGRPRAPLNEQVFCCIQKVYSQLSSRRARSLYVNAQDKQQISKALSYNMVNLALNKEELTSILMHLVDVTARPLKCIETKFAVDSSGFSTNCFYNYAEEKYKLGRQHKWLKAHVVCGVRTNIITAVKITDEHGADSPQFKELVTKTAENFAIQEVMADKAYLSRDNLDVVHDFGAIPYIPFKVNSIKKPKGSFLWKKMYHYFELNNDEFMKHYHARSNVESVFSSIKKKFGETLKSKNPTAQQNELLCKIIAYNITVLIHEMYELGIQPQFCSKTPVPAQEIPL